jgi:glucose/arabinose dehydrogenase
VRSRSGKPLAPFRLRFTTSPEVLQPDARLVFAAERFDGARSMTTVLFGPDRRLYAADAFGSLVRWEIAPDGRPVRKTALLRDPTESRQYIDLEWDPDATAVRLVLWVSYGERLAPQGPRHFFTGTVARLTLGEEVREEVVLRGLPHGREKIGGFESLPHQPNGLAFREGKLYQSVGSTSSSGGPPNWGIVEQPLSACILEIDYRRLTAPLDVHPETRYDPATPEAPVRIFATGVRNALEVVTHSNGHLYTATNINDRGGRGDGVPDDPDIPGDQNALVTHTTPDHECLYRIERGRHYGFPNPARGQYVLGGGNPTAGEDPFEIADYPVGTPPEPGFAPELSYPLWVHGGTSPDGMIEYLPAFDHPLRHALLVCFFSSGVVAALPLGERGLPAAVDHLRAPDGKLRLAGPLDITQDPATGILYVADFGKQGSFGADGSMVLLRPAIAPGREATR